MGIESPVYSPNAEEIKFKGSLRELHIRGKACTNAGIDVAKIGSGDGHPMRIKGK